MCYGLVRLMHVIRHHRIFLRSVLRVRRVIHVIHVISPTPFPKIIGVLSVMRVMCLIHVVHVMSPTSVPIIIHVFAAFGSIRLLLALCVFCVLFMSYML